MKIVVRKRLILNITIGHINEEDGETTIGEHGRLYNSEVRSIKEA